MFPKSFKLFLKNFTNKSQLFRNKKIFGCLDVFYIQKNNIDSESFKLLVIIPKKVVKKAVLRNFYKRKIYSFFIKKIKQQDFCIKKQVLLKLKKYPCSTLQKDLENIYEFLNKHETS